MFHIIVLALMRNLVGHDELGRSAWFPWLLAYLAATCCATWLIANYFSVPANKFLRQRLLRSPPPNQSIPALVTAA